jgi:hypothetical protein
MATIKVVRSRIRQHKKKWYYNYYKSVLISNISAFLQPIFVADANLAGRTAFQTEVNFNKEQYVGMCTYREQPHFYVSYGHLSFSNY